MAFILGLMMLTGFDPSVLTIPVVHAEPDYSTTTLKAYAQSIAERDGLNAKRFIGTLECESAWIWNAKSHTNDHGVAQINARWHPNITKEQMYDPYWSMEWAANEWKTKGVRGAKQWVCYKNLYL